jgi:hypothetical protein
MERLNNAATRAINGLPAAEAEAFDYLVADDGFLKSHFDQFQRVADELVEGLPAVAPAPSPDIWARIAHEVGFIDEPSATLDSPHTPISDTPDVVPMRRRGRNVALTVASIAAALVIGVAAGSVMTDSPTDLRQVAATAASEAGSTTIDMANPATSSPAASAVLTADGTGYLVAESLPALSDDRTYQLWVIVDDRVISAALLGTDPDVVEFRAEGNIVGMAISEEVAGGVVVSENDPVALWLDNA